jgi:hypothetical protein
MTKLTANGVATRQRIIERAASVAIGSKAQRARRPWTMRCRRADTIVVQACSDATTRSQGRHWAEVHPSRSSVSTLESMDTRSCITACPLPTSATSQTAMSSWSSGAAAQVPSPLRESGDPLLHHISYWSR